MRGIILKCAECGCDSHEMNTDNRVVAQRILVEHYGWRAYPAHEEVLVKKFNLACKECVRLYAIRKSKEKRVSRSKVR